MGEFTIRMQSETSRGKYFVVFYKVLWRCFHGSSDILLQRLYTRLGSIRVRREA